MSTTTTTTTTTVSEKKPHILIFPYPAQGHMLALLDLTLQLSVNHNFTITIITTPKNLPILSPLLSAATDIQTLVLPFPPHPKIPPGVENVRDLGNIGILPIMSSLTKLSEPIIHWFHSHPNPPIAIISDFFLGWTLDLATQLGIPRIVFHSTAAYFICAFNYLWNNSEAVKSSNNDAVSIHDLPGSPVFKEEHLPTIFRRYKLGDPDFEFLKHGMLANTKSWGYIINSFQAFEGVYLDLLKKKLSHHRVFSVGPLSLAGTNTMGDTSQLDLDLLTWLDDSPDGSVLYVCFGSQKLLNRAQMESMASGLQNSKVKFIWVSKPGTNGYGAVPEGFEERVAGRGMVIKGWAPQCCILNHKAVGGFLSHCGWNSTLEGIAAGVRFFAWPMEADQFLNARLLVEEKGLGVMVCEGADSVPDPIELSRVICDSMGQSSEEDMSRVKEMRDEAFAALKSGGSSMRDFEKLVNELLNSGNVM
ncbi:hypothetical protein ACFE04_012168 [Oxalis oulophora]